MFYFGRWQNPGHYLYLPSGHTAWGYRVAGLEDRELDSNEKVHLPGQGQSQPEGVTALIHRDASDGPWTILGMWDRTGDQRYGSRSLFIAQGQYSEAEMWRLAEEHFPSLVARIKTAFPSKTQ